MQVLGVWRRGGGDSGKKMVRKLREEQLGKMSEVENEGVGERRKGRSGGEVKEKTLGRMVEGGIVKEKIWRGEMLQGNE